MAQLVKLEPGDILVLSNVGEEQAEAIQRSWESVREALGVEHILVFEGDVDLSKVSPDELAGS
jgi:carbonic anhydrase